MAKFKVSISEYNAEHYLRQSADEAYYIFEGEPVPAEKNNCCNEHVADLDYCPHNHMTPTAKCSFNVCICNCRPCKFSKGWPTCIHGISHTSVDPCWCMKPTQVKIEKLVFSECRDCRTKSGSPVLCHQCWTNGKV